MGLLTTLTGSLAFVVYVAAAGILDRLKKYRYIYGMLLLVFPFWLFPGLYLFFCMSHIIVKPGRYCLSKDICLN